MKLEIDTEKDSRATLKGVLRMLQAILGEEGEIYSNRPVERSRSRNIFDDSSPSVSMYGEDSEPALQEYSSSSSPESGSGGLFSMFDDSSSGTSSDTGTAANSETIEEDPEDTPEIQVY